MFYVARAVAGEEPLVLGPYRDAEGIAPDCVEMDEAIVEESLGVEIHMDGTASFYRLAELLGEID